MAIPGSGLIRAAGGRLSPFARKAAKAIPVAGAAFTAYDAYNNYNEATQKGDDPGRAATRGIFGTLGGFAGGMAGGVAGGGVASLATGIAGGVAGRAAGDAFGAKVWDKFTRQPDTPVPQPMSAEEQRARRRSLSTAPKPINAAAGRFRFGADTPELAMAEMNVDAGKFVTGSRERVSKGDQYNQRYLAGLQTRVTTGDQYNERYMGGLQAKMVAGEQYNQRFAGGLQLAGLKNTNLTQQNIAFRNFASQDRATEAQRQIGLSGIESQRQIGLDQGRTSRFNTQAMVGGQIRINLDNNITSRQANQLQAGVANNQTFANERTAQRQFEAQKHIAGSGDLRTRSQLALGLDTNRVQQRLGLDANATQRYLGGSGDRKTDAQVEMARIAAGATRGQMQFQQQAANNANYQAYLAEERGSQRQKKQIEEANALGYLQTLGSLYR